MPTIQYIRQQYPQYNDMPDDQLAHALHDKFYSDMPFDAFAGKIGLQQPGLADQALGLAKAAGTGLEKGAIAVAGMPGDIGSGVDWVMNKITGASPERQAKMAQLESSAGVPGPPTSRQIMGVAQSAGVPFHQPQNTAEKYAETIGSFVPGSMLGPGGAASKIGSAVAGGAASETAGQMTEGTALEPYARFAGGVIGGGGAAAIASSPRRIVSQVAKAAPAAGAVKTAASQMYDQLRNAGIRYDPNAYQQLADAVSIGAVQSGFRKAQAPLSFDIIDHLNSTRGLTPDFSDIDRLRKSVGAIVREPNATQTDKALAGRILDSLDTFSESAPIAPSSSMPAQQAAQLAGQAREMARRNIISRDVDEMMRKAETYQSGYASGLRNQFSNYLRSPRGKRLTPEEQQAFMEAAKGNFATNVLNTIGRFGFDFSKLGNIASFLPSAGAGAAYLGLGPLGATGVAIGGTAAKYAGRRMSENLAERAKDITLAGTPGQQAIKIANSNQPQRLRDILVRSLLSGDASQATQP